MAVVTKTDLKTRALPVWLSWARRIRLGSCIILVLCTVTNGRADMPASPTELLAKARTQVARQQYEAAIVTYREYLDARPDDDEVRATLGRVLSWQGQYKATVALYEDVLSRHPLDTEVRVALAQVTSWQKKFAEAQQIYRQILKEEPNNRDAKRGLADVFYWSGEYERALDLYVDLFASTHDTALLSRIEALRAERAARASLASPSARVGPINDGLALPYRSYLKSGYSFFSLTTKVPNEQSGFVEIARPFGAQTVIGRIETVDRLGSRDTILSGEVDSPLWKGAWGYLGASFGLDPQFSPRWTMAGEIFQNLGVVDSHLSFVEPSFGYRRLNFRTATADMCIPGLTLYLPYNLWFTEKMYYALDTHSKSFSSSLTWRMTDRVQMFTAGTFGTSAERVGALQDLSRTSTWILQGGITFPLMNRLSAEVLGYHEDRNKQYSRRGGSIALIYHW